MVTYSTAETFRALADPTRRALLDLLREGPTPVHELASRFPVSRPAISKHLRLLREAGLVSERRSGRESIYTLDPAPLSAVDDWVASYRGLWQRRLARLKKHVESGRRAGDGEGRRTSGGKARATEKGGHE